jgi:hypothetical protein
MVATLWIIHENPRHTTEGLYFIGVFLLPMVIGNQIWRERTKLSKENHRFHSRMRSQFNDITKDIRAMKGRHGSFFDDDDDEEEEEEEPRKHKKFPKIPKYKPPKKEDEDE